jgi:hypothetical protein
MKRTELRQEIRKTGFEQALEGWASSRLTQAEAARLCANCPVKRLWRGSMTIRPPAICPTGCGALPKKPLAVALINDLRLIEVVAKR